MKKIILLIILLISVFGVYAQKAENAFRFEFQDSNSSYQKYVGRVVRFREALGSLEKETSIKATLESDYIVKSIVAEEVASSTKEKNFDITIIFEDRGGKTIKVKACHSGYTKKKPLITQIPLYFVDEFEEFKKEFVGKIIEKKPVKTTYKINDIVIGNRKNRYGYLFPVPLYELINSETGEKTYYSTIVPVDGLFEEALDQFIAYKLSKVETDNNSIIANDNHGYSDSIIYIGLDSHTGLIPGFPDWGYSLNGHDRLYYYIKNNSNTTIKVLWNDAVFINRNGGSSKMIIYNGTKDDAVFINRNNTVESSSVIKGANISGELIPVKNIDYRAGKWNISPILKDDEITAPTIKVMIPIQYQDKVIEYICELEVVGTYKHPELLDLSK